MGLFYEIMGYWLMEMDKFYSYSFDKERVKPGLQKSDFGTFFVKWYKFCSGGHFLYHWTFFVPIVDFCKAGDEIMDFVLN